VLRNFAVAVYSLRRFASFLAFEPLREPLGTTSPPGA
jgi:hypothetical protein